MTAQMTKNLIDKIFMWFYKMVTRNHLTLEEQLNRTHFLRDQVSVILYSAKLPCRRKQIR